MKCFLCQQEMPHGYSYEVTPKTPPQWAQDALVGAALRRLREALPEGWILRLDGPYPPSESSCVWWVELMSREWMDLEADYGGATIAEAADKCREALDK